MPLLDAYSVRARLAPGLLTTLPVGIGMLALGLEEAPVLSSLTGIASACGLPVLLANTVGIRGRHLQMDLARRWGGLPATKAVRHAEGFSTSHQRRIWRERLQAATGHILPDANEEADNPADADARYESAIQDLIERTRDTNAYRLVFEENCTFGFERNMLAMRKAGLWVACLTAVVLGCAVIVDLAANVRSLSLLACSIALLLCAALAFVWWYVPSEARVRAVAERYADRLFGSLATTPKLS